MTQPKSDCFDVIVLGAGSIGVPAAFSLAQSGLKTLVLDPLPSVGQGSNKSAIGGIRATHSDPAKIRICQRSIEIFATWKEIFGDEIEWHPGGYCFVAYREQEKNILQELLKTQKSFGLNIDWYNAAELRARIPAMNPEGLLGGTYAPEDGNASPLLAIHAFYRHAMRLGAQFHFGEAATAIQTRSGRITAVDTPRGTYSAGVVINAAGPWAAQVGAMAGVCVPVQPDSHEAGITEPVTRFIDPMVVDIRPTGESANFYFYQHITGQVLFCITPSPSIVGMDIRETSPFLPIVSRRMIEIMPRLTNLRVRRTWRGLYPMTPDGMPVVGWSQRIEGWYNAVGMCGQGFMLGPGLGEFITREVLGLPQPGDELIAHQFSPDRQFNQLESLR